MIQKEGTQNNKETFPFKTAPECSCCSLTVGCKLYKLGDFSSCHNLEVITKPFLQITLNSINSFCLSHLSHPICALWKMFTVKSFSIIDLRIQTAEFVLSLHYQTTQEANSHQSELTLGCLGTMKVLLGVSTSIVSTKGKEIEER